MGQQLTTERIDEIRRHALSLADWARSIETRELSKSIHALIDEHARLRVVAEKADDLLAELEVGGYPPRSRRDELREALRAARGEMTRADAREARA